MAKKAKTQTVEHRCPFCGSTNLGEDNGQWFCMDCGWEVPAPGSSETKKSTKKAAVKPAKKTASKTPVKTASKAAATPASKPAKKAAKKSQEKKDVKLATWWRLGVTVMLTPDEIKRIGKELMGPDELAKIIKTGFQTGDAFINGDTYMPERDYDDKLNKLLGTDEEINYDLYLK